MLYVMHGEDDYTRHQALQEIKKSIGDETILAPNMAVLDGQQVTLDQLKGACETMPFLAEHRLVIIEGLLERFERKGKSLRKKPKLAAPESEHQPLATYLGKVPDFTIVVLLDGKIAAQNPLLKELVKTSAKIETYPLLRGAALRQWIERRVAAQGGSIASPAADLLARFVGSNLWTVANEIDKLVVFVAGRRIEEADVRTVVSDAQEAKIFTMVDAIMESRGSIAGELLQRLLQQGDAPSYLLVMLARQARILVQVKELAKSRLSTAELQSRLGITQEFLVGKALEQAGKYSLARLTEVYHKLLEADIAIKTGRYDPELALEILVAELCQGQKQSYDVVH